MIKDHVETNSYRKNIIKPGTNTIEFKDFNVYLWYANNKGRGRDNCTIKIVEKGHSRAMFSKKQTGVITTHKVSAFRGIPNICKNLCEYLGIPVFKPSGLEYITPKHATWRDYNDNNHKKTTY